MIAVITTVPAKRGCPDVDLAEPLVPPVAAEAADRLAAPAEEHDRPEAGHDGERAETGPQVAADPLRDQDHDAEREREARNEPLGASQHHMSSVLDRCLAPDMSEASVV